jgi:hypothetical protein
MQNKKTRTLTVVKEATKRVFQRLKQEHKRKGKAKGL